MADILKMAIWNELQELEKHSTDELLDRRYKRLRSYGAYEVS